MNNKILTAFALFIGLIAGMSVLTVFGGENDLFETGDDNFFSHGHHGGGHHHDDHDGEWNHHHGDNYHHGDHHRHHTHDHWNNEEDTTYEWLYLHLDSNARRLVDGEFAQRLAQIDFADMDETAALAAIDQLKEDLALFIRTEIQYEENGVAFHEGTCTESQD